MSLTITLSPHTVIRPEPGGALLFQQEEAETALLDLDGLDALYFLLRGELRDYPPFFVAYLRRHRFVVESPPDGSLERVAQVRDAAPTTVAPPHALAAPETIHFSVTGRCDQACAGCFYSARPGSAVTATDAPFDLFERVVRQASDARVFQMALGGGEPLLHPRITDMIAYCHERGLHSEISTNATLLDERMSREILRAGLGTIYLCMDGVTKETYEKVRRHGDFEATKENILRFLRMKTASSDPTPEVKLQLIEIAPTAAEIEEFKELWHVPGVDRINIKAFDSWGGQIEEISQLRTDDRQVNIARFPCPNLWYHVHIYWDGTLVRCDRDFDAVAPLGNVANLSLIHI